MNKVDTITLHVGHTVMVEITPLIEETIEIARTARLTGMSKVDSVRKIYPMIVKEPKEAIWYAIMHGVDLSSRGAVTYYYNMRRESKRQGSR